jgi:hypothetical protein
MYIIAKQQGKGYRFSNEMYVLHFFSIVHIFVDFETMYTIVNTYKM